MYNYLEETINARKDEEKMGDSGRVTGMVLE